VKAASDLYLPVAGTVVAVNTALDGAPETVNQSPYDNGWIIKLKVANPDEAGALLSADDYAKLIG
jgi:glycine cleavage system H protein